MRTSPMPLHGWLLLVLALLPPSPARAGDADERAKQAGRPPPPPTEARFTLHSGRIAFEPHSADGAITLRSSFKAMPAQPVQDQRMALISRFRAKATDGAACSSGGDLFANGFE